jgi:hypothetical protein
MNIAYLVFAYRNPKLLERLIARLALQGSDFFIHIDKKSNIEKFRNITGDNVHFSEDRLAVYWAEFSGVRAILLLIRAALAAEKTYDYLILLSGSEYPLRSAHYIRAFLARNHGREFISMVKVPNDAAGKPLSRINTLRYESTKPVRRLASRALAKFGLGQRDYRNYLGSLQAYSGDTWWGLTREACQYILSFAAVNQHFERYFCETFAPEEMFFHTILGNSVFASRVLRNFVYEDWPVKGAHPKVITAQHLLQFESAEEVWLNDVYGTAEALFARKFNDDSLDLLQRMDDAIKNKG